MALDVTGRITRILPAQTGDGRSGQWTKQEFVIETEERFPKSICFSAWNDKTALIQGVSIGTQLKVSFEVSSREFNGKWYHELKAWKIEKFGAVQSEPAKVQPTPEQIQSGDFVRDEDDLAF